MNNKIISILLAATVVSLTACNNDTKNTSSTTAATVSKADAIAEVNGKYISKNSLALLKKDIAQNSRGQNFPTDKLIEELVQRELLVQDALNKQLDQSKEFTEQFAVIKNSLLSRAAVQNHLKSNEITDAILKAEYDKNVSKAGSEYKARHILVKTEDEAKQIIVELTKGSDFAELAKTKSTGPSGPNGGDLGWFGAGQMVAPFSEAVIALADNKFTTEPVQTQFGWHIILREGSRSKTPPSFDSVKEQIRPKLQRQIIQDYMESLRSQAKVEIFHTPPAPTMKDEPNKEGVVGESLDATAKKVADSAANIKGKIDNSVKDAASKLTKTVGQAKETVKNTAESVVTETAKKAEQVKESAVKNASEAMDKLSDKTTKALDSVTQ